MSKLSHSLETAGCDMKYRMVAAPLTCLCADDGDMPTDMIKGKRDESLKSLGRTDSFQNTTANARLYWNSLNWWRHSKLSASTRYLSCPRHIVTCSDCGMLLGRWRYPCQRIIHSVPALDFRSCLQPDSSKRAGTQASCFQVLWRTLIV